MADLIKIATAFYARYTLIVESDMMAVNVTMKSKVQIRWDFRVINLTDEAVEVELLLLDNILLESNNPLIKEIAGISQIFGRMFSELHLLIDHKGKIISVLNTEFIKNKWVQTKKEMLAIADANDEIKKVINLNDALFQNEEKLKASIQGSEFFIIYFNEVYNNNLPFAKSNIQKNNFFNTITIPWEHVVKVEKGFDTEKSSATIMVQLKSLPAYKLDNAFYEKAYSQFAEQIDITKLKTELKEEGTYIIESSTGKLLEAVLQRNEIADAEKLFTKITYTLIADNRPKTILQNHLVETKYSEKKKRFIFLNE